MSITRKLSMGAGADVTESGWTLNNVRVPDLGGVVDISDNVAATNLSMFFKPDGTQVFFAEDAGLSATRLETFDLSTAYDVTTVSHTRQNNAPLTEVHKGIFWKPDGTKIFFVFDSVAIERIYSYDVSVAWNTSSTFSNATYIDLNVSSNDPRGIFIDSSGTHLYHTDSSDLIFEYSMSTAWDLSTATYVASFDPNDGTKVSSPRNVWFKSDGSAFYIDRGATTGIINEYALSTAWDITTASFTANVSMDWGRYKVPSAWTFDSSGTRIFFYVRNTFISSASFLMSGTLSTAWDISTFTVDYPASNFYDTIDKTITGVSLNGAGTKLYLTQSSSPSDQFFQYNLSTAYALASAPAIGSPSATYDANNSYAAKGSSISSDGLNFYTLQTDAFNIFGRSWTLGTADDISSISSSSVVNAPNAIIDGTSAKDIWIDADKDRLWMVVQAGQRGVPDRIITSLPGLVSPTPWQSLVIGSSSPRDVFFKPDGTKMFWIRASNDRVYEYALSTAFDLETATSTTSFLVSGEDNNPWGLAFKSDGTKMYIAGQQNDSIYEYDLSTAWDVSTASYTTVKDVSTEGTQPTGVEFKTDGTKMYVVNSGALDEYSLSTAWDISTASFDQTFALPGSFSNENVRFKSDGLQIIVGKASSTNAAIYPLSTAWDISTIGTATSSTTVMSTGSDWVGNGLFISSDGTKVFQADTGYDQIIRGDLSTAWDLSDTIVQFGYDEYSLDISTTFTSTVDSLALDPDGRKMIVLGDGGKLAEYTFTTPWDTGTVALTQTYTLPSELADPERIFINLDGVHLFVTTALGIYKLTL